MARLARWSVPGLAHHVMLPGHNGQAVFTDDDDRAMFLAALKAAVAHHPVVMHAAAPLTDAAHLLLRPSAAADLGAVVQNLGRRFVAAYNARHRRSGTPWNGRFRAAPLEPGASTLLSLRLIDAWGAKHSELAHRWSAESGWWADPPELWALGNTPFEREQAYGELKAAGVSAVEEARVLSAVRRGLPLGSARFLAELEESQGRPALARRRGRPVVKAFD